MFKLIWWAAIGLFRSGVSLVVEILALVQMVKAEHIPWALRPHLQSRCLFLPLSSRAGMIRFRHTQIARIWRARLVQS